MKAMILAAGLGTRLRPLTDTRPKALVEINGRTLLEITLTRLRTFGVTEAIPNAAVDELKSAGTDYPAWTAPYISLYAGGVSAKGYSTARDAEIAALDLPTRDEPRHHAESHDDGGDAHADQSAPRNAVRHVVMVRMGVARVPFVFVGKPVLVIAGVVVAMVAYVVGAGLYVYSTWLSRRGTEEHELA